MNPRAAKGDGDNISVPLSYIADEFKQRDWRNSGARLDEPCMDFYNKFIFFLHTVEQLQRFLPNTASVTEAEFLLAFKYSNHVKTNDFFHELSRRWCTAKYHYESDLWESRDRLALDTADKPTQLTDKQIDSQRGLMPREWSANTARNYNGN